MDTVGRQIIEEERGRSKGQEWVKEEEKVVEGGGERAGGGELLFGVFESSRSRLGSLSPFRMSERQQEEL